MTRLSPRHGSDQVNTRTLREGGLVCAVPGTSPPPPCLRCCCGGSRYLRSYLFSPRFPALLLYPSVKNKVVLSGFGFLSFVLVLGCLTSCLTPRVVRREMFFQAEGNSNLNRAVKGTFQFKSRGFASWSRGLFRCYRLERAWTSARVRPQLRCLESCPQSFWIVFSLPSDLVSALLIGGGWRAVGSGANTGSPSAAETRLRAEEGPDCGAPANISSFWRRRAILCCGLCLL